VVEAEALLEVVDATHENAVEQSQTVNDVLEELGASDKPRITALNKSDLLANPASVDTAIYPNAVAVSAVTGRGLEALLAKIGEVLTEDMLYLRALVPYSRGDLLEQWRRRGRVLRQNETEEGTRVEGLAPRAVAALLAPYRLPDEPARRSRFARSYEDDDESGENAGVDGAKVRLD
jgi:GTP-binding protein HflX